MKKQFQLRLVNNIEFEENYGKNLFSTDYKAGFFEVVLEYDISNEFELTNKIDASFFEKDKNSESNNAKIHFYTADLSWTARFILKIWDKVRVISPPELFCEVKYLNK